MKKISITSAEMDVINTDYGRGEVDRSAADRYKRIHRGSVRIVRDLYRTEAEQREFVEAGLKLKLIGQK